MVTITCLSLFTYLFWLFVYPKQLYLFICFILQNTKIQDPCMYKCFNIFKETLSLSHALSIENPGLNLNTEVELLIEACRMFVTHSGLISTVTELSSDPCLSACFWAGPGVIVDMGVFAHRGSQRVTLEISA